MSSLGHQPNGFRDDRGSLSCGAAASGGLFIDEDRIVINFMTGEQHLELVEETQSAMVFLLAIDIAAHQIDLRVADGENRIASLPSE